MFFMATAKIPNLKVLIGFIPLAEAGDSHKS